MSCEIIQISSFAAARTAEKATEAGGWNTHRQAREAKRAAALAEVTAAPEQFTETCKNQRFRLSRRDTWWAADRLTDYWLARLKWQTSLEIAQSNNVADSNSFPKCDDYGARGKLVDLWRAALLKQMLTPAPDQNAVNWKRAQLAGRNADANFGNDAHRERLQRAIDADVEWLKAHPSRKSIAASRQAMKGGEIAAAAATMTEADQQAIRATVREILQERDQ